MINDRQYTLPPEDARHAELHLRKLLGEDLTGSEEAELARATEASPQLFADLDTADAALCEAFDAHEPGAKFPVKVMTSLPSEDAAKATT